VAGSCEQGNESQVSTKGEGNFGTSSATISVSTKVVARLVKAALKAAAEIWKMTVVCSVID